MLSSTLNSGVVVGDSERTHRDLFLRRRRPLLAPLSPSTTEPAASNPDLLLDHPRNSTRMEEDTQWNGLENGIDDPEELQVIYRTLDSYQ